MMKEHATASRRLQRMQCTAAEGLFRMRIVSLRAHEYAGKAAKLNIKWHKHTFFELHSPIVGSCTYCFERGAVPLEQGQVLLIRPDTLHRVEKHSKNFSKYAITFEVLHQEKDSEAERIAGLLYEHPCQIFHNEATLALLFDRMLDEALRNETGARLAIYSLCQQMVVEIARNVLQTGANALMPPLPYDTDARVDMLKKYVEAHIAQTVTNKEAAEHLHISIKQLYRLLHTFCGCTPQKFVCRIKCAYAKERMRDSAVTLQQISEKLGFSSEYSFNRFFRREEGMTPGKMRRAFIQY